jgi:hypothetical protein
MKALRASAYTAYHVTAAASRFEAAVIEAACVHYAPLRNVGTNSRSRYRNTR